MSSRIISQVTPGGLEDQQVSQPGAQEHVRTRADAQVDKHVGTIVPLGLTP